MAHDDDNTEDLQVLAATATEKAEEMVRRADQLMAEFQQLNDLRQARGLVPVAAGQRSLRQVAGSEHAIFHKHLQDLQGSADDDDDARKADLVKRLGVSLRCSNLPALEATWGVVKRCRGLESLVFAFSRHPAFGACSICKRPPPRGPPDGGAVTGTKPRRKKCPPKNRQDPADLARVDAVVEGGTEWVRVLGISERSLLMHMAQGGWDWGAEEGEREREEEEDDDADCDVSVAVTVRQLVEAARANRHDYRVPRVHVVLTRVAEGRDAEIDRLIRLLRRGAGAGAGAEVEVVVDCAGSAFLAAPPPPADEALRNLTDDGRLWGLTPTVNLDCTVLVTLASDVTHGRVEVRPWHSRETARQVVDELEQGSTLVRFLYPALRGRRLVCTRAAARRFGEIVDTIATPTEAARAAIIMGNPLSGPSGMSSPALVAELQTLSEHTVDPDLLFPIEVVDAKSPADDIESYIRSGRLPQVAAPVLAEMSELNRDSHLYGWVQGVTTVTANLSLAKQIARLVEEHRTSDDEAGPKVWVHPVTRALAAKEKRIDEATP
ncbi:hypothetical protein QBC33DRAFT_282130 [Phialemonium atrogriseum]|uniref:DUF1308 domain-containing protein n=1 Tax=Phialemonium atrogriseum TaxID=1093897 RepID=A0AAJ0BV09_9PEZI|nr:uncharacterized protein QBC33DRAFT_282130 [Phialemonium atrogriseum]KAK1762561.1 hypothetical protein QBC33DRAFT_282130 [Phialemonium atrogriseum]